MTQLSPGATGTEEVLFARSGALGRIHLNRPRSINALTLSMVRAMATQLTAWATDDGVSVVALTGAGDRGLCSGGDVRALRTALIDPGHGADRLAGPQLFWAEEYALNLQIAEYDKPVVALMDGVVMGGGIGLSVNAPLRLVTGRTRMAMPETIIGFFPDVGAGFALSRAPGQTGTHLALTATTIDGADAIDLGLADALIETEDLPTVLDRLSAGERLDNTVGARPGGGLRAQRSWIDDCYRGDDPVAIRDRLTRHRDAAARAAATQLGRRSPLSVAVALAAIRRARSMNLAQVLAQDRRLSVRFAPHSDLIEGVRAQLVDRDFAPRWRHRDLTDVDPAEVAAFFTD